MGKVSPGRIDVKEIQDKLCHISLKQQFFSDFERKMHNIFVQTNVDILWDKLYINF